MPVCLLLSEISGIGVEVRLFAHPALGVLLPQAEHQDHQIPTRFPPNRSELYNRLALPFDVR